MLHAWSYVILFLFQRRRVILTPEQVSEFYAEHFGKPFFPGLIAYMSSGPILALVLAREKAVTCWQDLIGPTSAIKARMTHPERQAFQQYSMHFTQWPQKDANSY